MRVWNGWGESVGVWGLGEGGPRQRRSLAIFEGLLFILDMDMLVWWLHSKCAVALFGHGEMLQGQGDRAVLGTHSIRDRLVLISVASLIACIVEPVYRANMHKRDTSSQPER